jgi:hypothetical protein
MRVHTAPHPLGPWSLASSAARPDGDVACVRPADAAVALRALPPPADTPDQGCAYQNGTARADTVSVTRSQQNSIIRLDGSFDVRRSFDEMGWGSHECLPVYWEAIALLSTLQLLHYVWFCMLINIILVKLTESTEWHDSARDVYEGESDEEAEADPKPVAAKKAD